MAYLRKRKIGRDTYYYIMESRRQRSGKIVCKILEYLGRDPSSKRLAEAKRYWKVNTKPNRHERRSSGER